MALEFPTSRPLVVLALGAMSENDLALLEGAREAASRHREWDFVVLPGGYEASLRQLAEIGALRGAIGDFVSDAWLRALPGGRVRWVQVAQISRLEQGVNVTAPYREMGRRAAATLRTGGCATFAFAGVAGQFAARELETGFAGELAAHGRNPAATNAVTAPLLQEFLRGLVPPVGVLAASDRLARLVVSAARNLGWQCPRDLAVIGVGNERLESLHAGVALSSFELPSREIGRAAVEWLGRLLAGEEVADGLRVVPGAPMLHERASSLREGRGLERALAFARSHLGDALQVSDLAREAGMSRRAFEQALRREQGASPARWLREARCERAKHLLRATRDDIQSVGRQCGYPELAAFSAAFKQWTGRSPRAFRAEGA
jgi:LacI family transcriptional regulator